MFLADRRPWSESRKGDGVWQDRSTSASVVELGEERSRSRIVAIVVAHRTGPRGMHRPQLRAASGLGSSATDQSLTEICQKPQKMLAVVESSQL